MLGFLTLLIMLAAAFVYWREGLFTAFLMFFNVFLGGLVAFNFWEPLAARLELGFAGTSFHGFEDILVLTVLFVLTLGVLRAVTNAIAKYRIRFPWPLQEAGGAFFGLAAGYLTAGFLVCALQTLPWQEHFLGFDPQYEAGAGLRRVLPPDRVWLALMYRAGAYAFATSDVDERFGPAASPYERHFTFDKYGTFELRYARYRRYPAGGEPLPYRGELNQLLRGPS